MAPHERGQVAHVLRSVQGTKLFCEIEPAPNPEWICVLDANVRSAKHSNGYGDEPEKFDPKTAYGLDDDLENISDEDRRQGVANDNLLVWRPGDDNPHEFHRLGGRQADGFEATPLRLVHLINWISKSIDSPVVAWWALRQYGLHPRLLQQIEWRIASSTGLHERARHIWNLIIECHRDPRNRDRGSAWFKLKKRAMVEGWTASVLRQFRQVATPRIDIRPPLGLGEAKPPTANWDDIPLNDLAQFEVMFPKLHNQVLDFPDHILPQVFSILEGQFAVASGLLADIEATYFPTPTCYPDREVDGGEKFPRAEEVFTLFFRLFDRFAEFRPKLANAHATTWPETDGFFFRKLKLYAFARKNVFNGDHVAEAVLSFDQEAFWDFEVVREC